jgi:hypothetical protein
MIDESLLTNRFVEFHDAHVLDAIQKDGVLTICLHAFVHDNGKHGNLRWCLAADRFDA